MSNENPLMTREYLLSVVAQRDKLQLVLNDTIKAQQLGYDVRRDLSKMQTALTALDEVIDEVKAKWRARGIKLPPSLGD